MKNIAAIRLLLLANFVSGIAQGISMISIPMYFANQNESNLFSIIYACITVVSLFWSPYGGTLIDKYDRKKIFLLLNIVNGVAIGTIAILEDQALGNTSYLAALVFALTFWNYNIHYPCFYAFMQEITEKENYGKIASYIEVQSQLASALAGASAAFLLGGGIDLSFISWKFEAWSLADVFTLDAMTYLLALVIIYMMKYTPLVNRSEEVGSMLSRLKTGYNYLLKNPYIFLFGVTTHAVFIVVLLHVFNLAPIYVTQCLDVRERAQEIFALSEIWYATGAIIAGSGIQRIMGKFTFVQSIIILTLISVTEFILMIEWQSIVIFYAMSLLLGITNAGIRVIRVSYLFTVIPNQVIGRANSIFFVTNALARVLFLLLFSLPFFHKWGNVIYSFAILTIFMFICAMILVKYYPKIVLKDADKD